MNITQLVDLMDNRGIASRSDLVGVSATEIHALESAMRLTFPAIYKQYLLTFGRSAGRLSTWMAIYFDDLQEIQEEFEFQIACKEIELTLAPSTLLVSNWGTVFDYISCNGDPDPAVFRMDLSGSDGPYCEQYSHSFSEYLEKLILSANDQNQIGNFYVDKSGHIVEGDLNDVSELGDDLLQKL